MFYIYARVSITFVWLILTQIFLSHRYRPRSSNVSDSHQCPSCNPCYHIGLQLDQCYYATRKDSTCIPGLCPSRLSESAAVCNSTHVMDNYPVCLKYNYYFSKCHDDSDVVQKYFVPKQRCRRLFDTRESYASVNWTARPTRGKTHYAVARYDRKSGIFRKLVKHWAPPTPRTMWNKIK